MSNYLDGLKNSYDKDFKFFDENIVMLTWYGQRVVQTIRNNRSKSVISLGIGHTRVSTSIISELGRILDGYLIIEGSQSIIDDFKRNNALPPCVSIARSFFEDFESDEKFDIVEMGFVLEHVDDPAFIINKYMSLLKPGGIMLIAVPNARSLHRLIGYKAGILDNLQRLSEYDLAFGHKRYFDLNSLSKIILSAGLKITKTEGIFLKPFSTGQLKKLNLAQEVLTALCLLGAECPEIANAIFVEAVL